MSEPVPLLIDPASMAGRALCVAARGVDALLSCGGALALHARHGERPTVLVLAAPGEGSGESEAALAPAFRRLGVEDLRVDTSEDPAAALARVCAELDPALVYAPLAAAVDPARRRVARAVAGALAGSDARRLMLYGLRVGVPAPALLDVATAQRAKRAALEALAPAPAAVAARSEALDRSRALVHPLVLHAEAFAPVAGDALEEFGSEIAREAWVAGGTASCRPRPPSSPRSTSARTCARTCGPCSPRSCPSRAWSLSTTPAATARARCCARSSPRCT